jgi:serine/threonine protein kinase
MDHGPRHTLDDLPAPFGRYRLLKLLGKGGMGCVYLAHDSQLDRQVALKVPQLDEDDSGQILGRFFTEARAAAALNHPHICRIHDVGEVDGIPYLTMAYIEGKPLKEYVRLKPPIHRQSALLVWKLALAVHEAHKHGIIHRDLKPANIMIDKRGEPSIMDFGLARRAGKREAQLTQAGQIMGTPAYMPPEQIQGDLRAIGPACDVYSLGVILYELLAGRLPFVGDMMVVLSRVLMDEPPPPSEFSPDLDPDLEAICLKAMAKQSKQRFGSMMDFAAALFDQLQGKTGIVPGGSGIRSAGRGSQSGGIRSGVNLNPDLHRAKDREHEATRSSATAVRSGKRPRRRKRSQSGRSSLPPWVFIAVFVALVAIPIVTLAVWLSRRAPVLAPPRAPVQSPDNAVVPERAPGGGPGGAKVPSVPKKDEGPPPKPPQSKPKPPPASTFPPPWRDSESWVLKGKELYQTDDRRAFEPWLLFGDPAWTDYDFEVETEILSGGSEANVVVRAVSREHCIFAILGGWENRFHGVLAPRDGLRQWPLLASVPGQTEHDRWYQVRVEARGDRFKVLLDGKPLLAFVSDKYPRGRVGLRTSGTGARFRNPKVTAPDGTVLMEGWPDLQER